MISENAIVEVGAHVPSSCSIWHLAHIRTGASLGERVIIGGGAYIDAGVTIGDDCKVQAGALIYAPAQLEAGVFIGPGVILTNDHLPRAITVDGQLKATRDWDAEGVHVEYGASLGAGVVCVAPIRVGRWAMIGSGSVVTKDVPEYALMTGVPARQIGWVSPAGVRLIEVPNTGLQCPMTGVTFRLDETGRLKEIQ